MKQQAKKIIKHPLIYGSGIVVFGGLIANFFNFLFNLYMSRNLSITDYGILASVISLISFSALLATAINPVIVKFAGSYFVKKDFAYLRGLYVIFSKFFFFLGLFVFILMLLNIGTFSSFFHIDNNPVILTFATIIIFLSIIGIINVAFIQAKLAFGFNVLLNLLGACIKFLLGMIFVSFGYSVTGAVGAILGASVFTYFFSYIPLKFIFYKQIKSVSIDNTEIIKYAIPSVLTLFGLTAFISMDIVLVKHFFDPYEAGLYAGLSILGRIIFYIVAPISMVLFPIIVRMHANKENYTNTFNLAFLLVTLPSLGICGLYYFFPDFSILFFLKKEEYLQISPYLVFFAIYITLYSILYILATFYLSIKKTGVYVPIVLAAILQTVLIILFHESIIQVIMISFVLVLLLVVGFLVYYLKTAYSSSRD